MGGVTRRKEEWAALRSLTEHSSDVMMVVDLDGAIQFVNWTIPGVTIEQTEGAPIFSFVPEEQRAAMRECFRRVQQTGAPGSYHVVYPMSGGGAASYWESKVAPITEAGQIVGFTVFCRDVTETTLRAAELNRFFELSVDLLCIANREGHFLRVNEAFTKTLGYSTEELLRRPFEDFLHPEDVAPTKRAVERLFEGEELVGFRNRYRTKDGKCRRFNWKGRIDPVNGLIFAMARDTTDQDALQQQLQHSQKMEAMGQLAGGVAHDFNNLMLAVLANTELALVDLGTGQTELQVQLEEVQKAGERAAVLTRRLLEFSKQAPPVTKAFDVNELTRSFIKMLRSLISASIEIDFVPGYRLPKISAESGQIDQVLMNLCVNARDAMPDGGRLTIETENVLINGRYTESHPWAKPGRYVLITVTDTGHGMTSDVKERLFEPFFTTKGPKDGTGLGLATTYAIVKQHGGLIHVYSEPGEGSSFKVYLPISERLAGEVGDKKDAGLPGGRETILVAEDEELVRNVIVLILERAGYRVLTARNGLEALKLFGDHQSNIDLVVLDVVMPELGGPETFDRLREISPGLPVLFSSGYTDRTRSSARLPAGAALLKKPYRTEELLRCVRDCLGGAERRAVPES